MYLLQGQQSASSSVQDSPVIEHDLCSLQQTHSLQCEQLRVTRPCADQVDLSRALVICVTSLPQQLARCVKRSKALHKHTYLMASAVVGPAGLGWTLASGRLTIRRGPGALPHTEATLAAGEQGG